MPCLLRGGIPFAAGSYGFLRERLDFKIRRVTIPTVRLPNEFTGMRIVQLSDFHMGDFYAGLGRSTSCRYGK